MNYLNKQCKIFEVVQFQHPIVHCRIRRRRRHRRHRRRLSQKHFNTKTRHPPSKSLHSCHRENTRRRRLVLLHIHRADSRCRPNIRHGPTAKSDPRRFEEPAPTASSCGPPRFVFGATLNATTDFLSARREVTRKCFRGAHSACASAYVTIVPSVSLSSWFLAVPGGPC